MRSAWWGLPNEESKLRTHLVDRSAILLSAITALSLFALHFIEIALFAIFYIAVGAIVRFEEALFFSASAYSTLGQPDVAFPEQWRLVGAIEGLIGFLIRMVYRCVHQRYDHAVAHVGSNVN